MGHFVFEQMKFARAQVIRSMEDVSADIADIVPDGFRNSIRWNLGHLYVVLERFSFQYIGLPQIMPDGFKEHFEYGTSPLHPSSAPLPSLNLLKTLLEEQPGRIEEKLLDRLQEPATPYTTSQGMRLETPEQFLSFHLFHEGQHLNTIKLYKQMLAKKK
ncbi:DinB family protein [Metabacillus mangrovi]|nr:DinB family protein [Metabacillus mangrovi]